MMYKYFEIRDRGTCMPALAIKVNVGFANPPMVNKIVRRAGYGPTGGQIILMLLEINECQNSSMEWGRRTPGVAHRHIEKHFDELENGQVIDVQYILGETDKPKETDLDEY